MIDARDYETTEELKAAMELEHNIAKKQHVDAAIEKLKIEVISFQGALQRLQDESNDLQRAIDNYYKSIREKNENADSNST